jgi:hypothetical protein
MVSDTLMHHIDCNSFDLDQSVGWLGGRKDYQGK